MDESRIERRLRREIEKLGGKALKFVSPGMAGVPDRIVLMPGGRLMFVELKAPGQTLRPLQVKRKRDLESLGFRVFVIDSYEELNDFIEMVEHGI